MKLLFIILCFELVCGRLPAGLFPKCSISDPKVSQCIVRGVEHIRPELVNGILEINFPRLEPFMLDEIPLDTSVGGIRLIGKAKNIVAHGASDFRIENLNFNPDTMATELTLLIPELLVTADFEVHNSKVFFLTAIDASGKFTGKLNNVQAFVNAHGRIEKKRGLDFVKLIDLTVDIDIGKGSTIHIDPDDDFTSKAAAKLINALPSNMVFRTIKPAINKDACPIIKRYVAAVLRNMPLQDLMKY